MHPVVAVFSVLSDGFSHACMRRDAGSEVFSGVWWVLSVDDFFRKQVSMFEERDFYQKKTQWGEVTTSIASIIIVLAGSSVPSLSWLIWFCIPLFLISFSLLLSNSFIGSWMRRWWSDRKNRKVLSDNYQNYRKYFDKLEVAQRLVDKLDYMEWGSLRPPSYVNLGNRMQVSGLVLQKVMGSGHIKFLIANYALKEYLDYVEGYLLHADRFVVNRDVVYRCESEKTELLHFLAKYQQFRDQHDEFISEVNKKLSSSVLYQVFGRVHSFVPKEIAVLNPEK